MSNTVQNVLDQIQGSYNQALSDMANLTKDETQLQKDEALADIELNLEHYTTSHWSWGACGETTVHHTRQSMINDYNSNEEHVASLQYNIGALETNLESLDSSSNLKDLLTALNGVNGGVSVTMDNNDGTTYSATEYLDKSDLKDAIHSLLEMIQQQLGIDEDLAETAAGGGSNGNLDLQVIQDQAKQATEFNSLSQTLESSVSSYTAQAGNAQVTKHGYSIVTQTVDQFGWGDANSKIDQAERQMRQAHRAISAIVQAQSDLAQVGADMATQAFSSILLSIDNILQAVQKILSNPHLTAKEKEEKLAQLLQLILGYIQIILQTAENLRSQNQQKMAKANVEAQKLNLQNMKTDGQIFEEVQKQQQELKVLQNVLIAVEVIATIALAASGSVGVAVAMLTMTTLDATKVTQHWTQDIANDLHNDGAKNSKLDADAIMTSISILTTLGAGGLIDALVSRITAAMVQAEVDAMTTVSEDLIKEAAEKAASSATDQAAGEAAAQTVIRQAVEQAAKTAASNAVKTFTKRSVSELITLRVRKSVTTEMTRAIRRSVQEAIETAVKDSMEAAKTAAMSVPSQAVAAGNLTAQAAAQASTQTVKEVVGNAVKKALNTILNAAKSVAKNQNVRSSLWAGVYTAASTNMVVDIATALQNRYHKISQKSFEEIVTTCMQIVQMLMEAIAVMKGGGFLSQAASMDPMPVLQGCQRASSVALIGSQAGDAGMNFQQYIIDTAQAKAVKDLEETQAFDNILRSYMDQDKGDTGQNNAGMSLEQKRLAQEQLWLSTHMWDGMEAGCKILAARSI